MTCHNGPPCTHPVAVCPMECHRVCPIGCHVAYHCRLPPYFKRSTAQPLNNSLLRLKPPEAYCAAGQPSGLEGEDTPPHTRLDGLSERYSAGDKYVATPLNDPICRRQGVN